MVHADQGPHLVGVWYIPPAPSEIATVITCKEEYAALEGLSLGNIILADLNVHDKRLLTHSSHNSIEGIELRTDCNDIGLQQKVTKPTSEDHRLDLVLTKVPGVRSKTLPLISDHKLAVAELQFKYPERVTIPPTIWVYAKANWDRMRSLLEETNRDGMKTMDPKAASQYSLEKH